MIRNQVPIVFLSQPQSIRQGWKICCQIHTTSSRSVPTMEQASDPLEKCVRCSPRGHVRQMTHSIITIRFIIRSKSAFGDSINDLFTAPPDPPRMWRYISWTGKWLYVWWDHIQYDWFGNISFPLYYKVCKVFVLTLLIRVKTSFSHLSYSDNRIAEYLPCVSSSARSCSESQATSMGRSTSLDGTSWTSPCLRLGIMNWWCAAVMKEETAQSGGLRFWVKLRKIIT